MVDAKSMFSIQYKIRSLSCRPIVNIIYIGPRQTNSFLAKAPISSWLFFPIGVTLSFGIFDRMVIPLPNIVLRGCLRSGDSLWVENNCIFGSRQGDDRGEGESHPEKLRLVANVKQGASGDSPKFSEAF